MKRFEPKQASDTDLLIRYQDGSEEGAFEELVRRHGGMVLTVGRRVLKDTHDAEDKSGYARALSDEMQRKQRELLGKVVASSDVLITTAQVPGQKAPLIITEEMVNRMNPGSVIVDLAAEHGGNCAVTRVDEIVEHNGVTILGPSNLPATVPYHASQMFAKNLVTFVQHIFKKGELKIDRKDEIVAGTMVMQGGEIVHPKVRERLGLPPLA